MDTPASIATENLNQVEALKRANATLKAALKKYGRHKTDCDVNKSNGFLRCDCGFAEFEETKHEKTYQAEK